MIRADLRTAAGLCVPMRGTGDERPRHVGTPRVYRWRRAVFGPLACLAALLIAAAAPAFAVTISVTPTAVSVPIGGDRQLSVFADGVATSAVLWTVNGIPNGDSTVGTISATGMYNAPLQPPVGWIVTATATSTADPNASASCTIKVRNQVPWTTSLNPNPIPIGSFTLQVIGSRFVSGAQVLWNGTALATTYNSATMLTAIGNASQAGAVSITVANPGPGAVSTPLTLTVGSAATTPTLTIATTATATIAKTATSVPTMTPTRSATSTRTLTYTPIPTRTPTITKTPTVTKTPTATPTQTLSPTPTATIDPMAITYGRFLSQVSFGATAQSTAHLAQVGMSTYLDEQFAMPQSPWPPLATAQRSDAVDAFFANALSGQDQLRQRVLYALSEIIVIAMNKNTNGNEIVPWLQLLSRNAFGNYRTLLSELTLDASMGKYLDLANSVGTGGGGMGGMGGTAANENYPREVMQLFSIGLYQLNLDGTVQVDAQNVGVPTYTQTDVQQLAKALSGWTYGNVNSTPPTYGNFSYYPGPMLPVAAFHNSQAKTILGVSIPAGQTAQQDLTSAINILFNHPNVGPFLATRLIRALVTSNPSPAFISRVATVFNDNGSGVRGDMPAVVRAIIMDPEARDDAPPANFGRLRTPMQHTIAMVRALNIPIGAASNFAYLFYDMNEGILDAASVFGHYSPSYHIPKTPLFGPEFQIYSASDAINRANFSYSFLYNPWPLNPALLPYVNVAGNAAGLVNLVDTNLLFGRMSASTRTAILNAIPAMPDNNTRVLTALYLTLVSGEYQVQR